MKIKPAHYLRIFIGIFLLFIFKDYIIMFFSELFEELSTFYKMYYNAAIADDKQEFINITGGISIIGGAFFFIGAMTGFEDKGFLVLTIIVLLHSILWICFGGLLYLAYQYPKLENYLNKKFE